MEIQYVVGIDEVGRGPVAGPVAIGAVCAHVSQKIEHEFFAKGIRDSKKLTQGKREALATWTRQQPELRHAVAMVGPHIIDRDGIVPAITLAVERALARAVPEDCPKDAILVLLDGGLHAPKEFTNQATIIKGDEKEALIALASIVAKVTRDNKMCELGAEHPEYGFENHKGYGTAAHYKAIKEHGLCECHRRSFCRRFL